MEVTRKARSRRLARHIPLPVHMARTRPMAGGVLISRCWATLGCGASVATVLRSETREVEAMGTKGLFVSFVVGLGVGVIYGLLRVKSPAPPIIALLGLLGMVGGEQLGTWMQ